MDKALIARKFGQSLNSYNQEAKAQKMIVARLLEYFETQGLAHYNRVLEFGTGTGLLTQEVVQRFSYNNLFLNDLIDVSESLTSLIGTLNEQKKISFLAGDIEQIELPKAFDLIISSSTEQWIENKDVFYSKIHSSLSENGYFVFSGFGPDNLKELRKATGVSLNYFE